MHTPYQRAERGEKHPLDVVDQALRAAIFGQDDAIDAVMRILNRAHVGFNAGHEDRPEAVLLFMGPTGVGKSECAKRLAQVRYPEGGLIKIDCSLFSEGHEIGALVGAPPSYVGREQRPLLDAEQIEKGCIVLFDEVEKGSKGLWNILLQIMEDGLITLLNGGKQLSFKKCLIILTTNVGAREMAETLDQRYIGFRKGHQVGDPELSKVGFAALQRTFQPEWINRIDEIITFKPLGRATLDRVLARLLHEANMKTYRPAGVDLIVSLEAFDLLLAKGSDARFGARPLRQQLLKQVEAPLADLLASGGIPQGSEVLLDVENGAFVFYYRPDVLPVAGTEPPCEPTSSPGPRVYSIPPT